MNILESYLHLSFRDVARVAPLAPFLVSHTCRDFICAYPRWGSAPVSVKPMSTVHRAYHLHSKAASRDSGYRRLRPFRLHNLYTSIIELTNPQKGIKKYENIQFKIFSDNIIIAKQLSQENKANDVVTLLSCVSNFLCSAVGDGVGWLVRGGITIGDFYIDDTIVWGPALLRAYELEDQLAIYPRIILDETVTNVLSSSTIKNDFVRVDKDGFRFLNYMDIWHFSGQFVSAPYPRTRIGRIIRDIQLSEEIFK